MLGVFFYLFLSKLLTHPFKDNDIKSPPNSSIGLLGHQRSNNFALVSQS